MKDFYSVLGVNKGATKAEIKSAYRKLALKWHPDRNKEAGAEKTFKEINHAYEVLSDDTKKNMYDQLGHENYTRSGGRAGGPGAGGGARPGGGSYQSGPFTYTYSSGGGSGNPFEGADFGGFSNPFDIFEQFFGGGQGFGGGFSRAQQKPTYHITIDFMEAVHGIEKQVTVEGKPKSLKIPAGVDEGMQIRYDDFNLVISVRPDKNYKRDGQNVYITREIPFTTAILGDSLEIPALDGKTIKVKVRPGTQPGTMLRLKGKGIKSPHNTVYGDMYIVFKITFPSKISKEQRKLIEEFVRA